MSDQNTVLCANPNCRMEIGRLVTVENVELLQMGGVLVRQAHGVCIRCGREFHWSLGDQMLERLIARVIKGEQHE